MLAVTHWSCIWYIVTLFVCMVMVKSSDQIVQYNVSRLVCGWIGQVSTEILQWDCPGDSP